MKDSYIFISYSSYDFDEADELKALLNRNGMKTWMAPENIPVGSNYATEISTAINNCDVFLIMISSATLNSKWVPKELERALNANKRIVPVMLEDCPLSPNFDFYLADVQRYFAYKDRSETYKKLIPVLKSALYNTNPPVDTYEPKMSTGTDSSKKPAVYILIAIVAVLAVAVIFLLSDKTGKSDTPGVNTSVPYSEPSVSEKETSAEAVTTQKTTEAVMAENNDNSYNRLFRPASQYFCSQYRARVFCTDTDVQNFVKMRFGPDKTAYGIVTKIPNYEEVVVETVSVDGWTLCIYDGTTEGWIRSDFLTAIN